MLGRVAKSRQQSEALGGHETTCGLATDQTFVGQSGQYLNLPGGVSLDVDDDAGGRGDRCLAMDAWSVPIPRDEHWITSGHAMDASGRRWPPRRCTRDVAAGESRLAGSRATTLDRIMSFGGG